MKRKRMAALLLLSLIASAIAGCGGSGMASQSMAESATAVAMTEESYDEDVYETATEEAKAEAPAEAAEGGGIANSSFAADLTSQMSNDKLVYTADIELETTNYKEDTAKIRERVRAMNGVIESESETDEDYNWYYEEHRKTGGTMRLYLTVRIPTENYDAFVGEMAGIGKVLRKTQNVENISRTYHNTEARIAALQKEEERLLAMMDAAETIEEMIYIEERLTEVESQLSMHQTSLSDMDTDVRYSTVHLTVREVMVYSKEAAPTVTFGQRIRRAFGDSYEQFASFLEGLIVFLIYALPFLVLGLLIFLIVRMISLRQHGETREERKAYLRAKKEAKRAERARRKEWKRAGRKRPVNAPLSQTGESANADRLPKDALKEGSQDPAQRNRDTTP